MRAEGSSGHRLHDLGGLRIADHGFFALARESLPLPVTSAPQREEGGDSDTRACEWQVGAEDPRKLKHY